jgi:hypothetical protein
MEEVYKMAETRFIRIRNFEKWQHYKDRSPIWIKLYTNLLDDADFGKLPDDAKAHLLLMWLLVARKGNVLPYNAEWIECRIGSRSPVNLNLLVSSGYCELCSADGSVLALSASTRREEESREETEKNREDVCCSTPPVVQRSLKPSLEQHKPDRDEEIYQAYPRHVSKQAALKAIKKARKAVHGRGVEHPGEWLLERTKQYATVRREVEATDPTQRQYTPYPASWFNAGRYDDDQAEWAEKYTGTKQQSAANFGDEVLAKMGVKA